jgi:transcriptional regulator with XRE-family HTH domain
MTRSIRETHIIPQAVIPLPFWPQDASTPIIGDMIGNAIRAARKRENLTQEQLAAMVGVEQGTIARYEQGKLQPPVAKLRKLAEALGVPIHQLTDNVGSATAVAAEGFAAPHQVYAPPPGLIGLRDLPVRGAVLGADLEVPANGEGQVHIERLEFSTSETIDYVKRPAGLAANREAYALYVQGSSMEPRHEQGDLVYVDPRRPPSPGDDVVVQLCGLEGDDQTVVSAMIKRLNKRTSAFVELEQYNPPLRFRLPVSQVHALHRVVRLAELLGV